MPFADAMAAGAPSRQASADAAAPIIRLAGIRKRYGSAVAIEHLDLDIARGAFFTLLGPSGSGKTTTLRMIAGFERPDVGRIELDGQDVAGLPPYARDVNTVFQDYALFPHMTVRENVAYGLRARHVPAAELLPRADAALAMVRLDGFGARRPGQLSGGQRQRVALARAIVNRPRVLLLDEPLGALDLKLRHQMQVELKALQRATGITFVYVTHDQDEALSMSDRVAVFNHGRIEQIGTPIELYEQPSSRFVAGFVGVSNLLRRGGADYVLRPERIHLLRPGAPADAGCHVEPVTVREVSYLGSFTRYGVARADGSTLAVVDKNTEPGQAARLLPGDRMQAAWRHDAATELANGNQGEPEE